MIYKVMIYTWNNKFSTLIILEYTIINYTRIAIDIDKHTAHTAQLMY